ncbi:MAG: hypothetical protein WBA46_18295 [Thermomicrobiales bacterium]
MRAHLPSTHPGDHPDGDRFAPDVVHISPDEWLILFEQEVQDALGIGSAAFVHRYRAGEHEERANPIIDLFSVSVPF